MSTTLPPAAPAGLFGKYVISKSDGSPVDPKAAYFVLRLDTDADARKAMRAYARAIKDENPKLAREIAIWLWDFAPGSNCNCRGLALCGHYGPEFWENSKLMNDVGARW